MQNRVSGIQSVEWGVVYEVCGGDTSPKTGMRRGRQLCSCWGTANAWLLMRRPGMLTEREGGQGC